MDAFDPVTEADRAAEKCMRAMIESRFPDHGILGEEFGSKATGSRWRWVLDPVDGTRGFICGIPTWTTLVGLELDQEPVVGVIAQPCTDEVWVGGPAGTTLFTPGGRLRCKVSGETDLSKARLTTTDPRSGAQSPLNDQEAGAFAEVSTRAKVVRFSLDAYGYGLLAMGALDLVVEAGLERYDISALAPVVRGAGGSFLNWAGEGRLDIGQVVAAATPELSRQAREVLQGREPNV